MTSSEFGPPSPEFVDGPDLGRLARDTFVRVSRQWSASVTAQAATVALEALDGAIPAPDELARGFRRDPERVQEVVDIANKVHAHTRIQAPPVTPERVLEISGEVFSLAQLIAENLPPHEIERIRSEHLDLPRGYERLENRRKLKDRLNR